MKINPQINQLLLNYGIPENDGIAYLLSIYFNCRPSYTPPLLAPFWPASNALIIFITIAF